MVSLGTLEIGLRLDESDYKKSKQRVKKDAQQMERDPINVKIVGDKAASTEFLRMLERITSNVSINIDSSSVDVLNKKLETTSKYLDEISNQYIRIGKMPDIQVKASVQQETEQSSTVSQTINANLGSVVIASELRNQTQVLRDAIYDLIRNVNMSHGSGGGGGAIGFIGKALMAPFGLVGKVLNSIVVGYLEGIGRDIPRDAIRSVGRKFKQSFAIIDDQVIGKAQAYETFFSELLDSGSFTLSAQAAWKRTIAARSVDRLQKLQKIATSTKSAEKQQIISSDKDLSAIWEAATMQVKEENPGVEQSRLLPKISNKFMKMAQPKAIFENVLNPFVGEMQPVLEFIQGMQAYRTSKMANRYYAKYKPGFPTLAEGENVVSVMGGAQNKSGQGGRQVAMSLEMLAPKTRFIPVENPETDADPMKPNQGEEKFKAVVRGLLGQFVEGELIDTAVNIFRQVSHAFDPMGYSTAAAQAIANTRLAEEQGRQGSVVSYSLGGADNLRYAQTEKYLGNEPRSLALAYPFMNFTQNTPVGFQAVLGEQDPLSFGPKLGLGIPTDQLSIEQLADTQMSVSAHHQKHLFKSIDVAIKFFNTIGADFPDITPDAMSSVVHAGDRLYEFIGSLKQVSSYLDKGSFDMELPMNRFLQGYKTGDPIVRLEDMINKIGEGSSILPSLKKVPGMEGLYSELETSLASVVEKIKALYRQAGAELPDKASDVRGYFKYAEVSQNVNADLMAYKTGIATPERNAYTQNLQVSEVAANTANIQTETIPWFKKEDFGSYKDQIIALFEESDRIAKEFIRTNGKLSQEFKDSIKLFPEINLDAIQGTLGAKLDTSLLPKEENMRLANRSDIPAVMREAEVSVLAFNRLLDTISSKTVPSLDEITRVLGVSLDGLATTVNLMTDKLSYKVAVTPEGEQRVANPNEVQAYERLQGRFSPLMYESNKGQALVVERVSGRTAKEILDRIAQPYREKTTRRQELQAELQSRRDKKITPDQVDAGIEAEIAQLDNERQSIKKRFAKAINILYEQIGQLGASLQALGVSHNDLAKGNVVFSQGGPVAIDFELATTQDPRAGDPKKDFIEKLITMQRALIDNTYQDIFSNPLPLAGAINRGYAKPLSEQQPRSIDESALNRNPNATKIKTGSTSQSLLFEELSKPVYPTFPIEETALKLKAFKNTIKLLLNEFKAEYSQFSSLGKIKLIDLDEGEIAAVKSQLISFLSLIKNTLKEYKGLSFQTEPMARLGDLGRAKAQLTNYERYVTKKLEEIKKVEDSKNIISSPWDDVGNDIILGTEQGMTFRSSELYHLTQMIFKDLEKIARDITETHSPSDVFKRIGGDLMKGLCDGIGKGSLDAIRDIQDIAKKINDSMSVGLEVNSGLDAASFESIAAQLGININKGLDEGVDGADEIAIKSAREFIEAYKKMLGIQSPSRIFREFGEYIIEGLNQGLQNTPVDESVINSFLERVHSELEAANELIKTTQNSDDLAELQAIVKWYEHLANALDVVGQTYQRVNRVALIITPPPSFDPGLSDDIEEMARRRNSVPIPPHPPIVNSIRSQASATPDEIIARRSPDEIYRHLGMLGGRAYTRGFGQAILYIEREVTKSFDEIKQQIQQIESSDFINLDEIARLEQLKEEYSQIARLTRQIRTSPRDIGPRLAGDAVRGTQNIDSKRYDVFAARLGQVNKQVIDLVTKLKQLKQEEQERGNDKFYQLEEYQELYRQATKLIQVRRQLLETETGSSIGGRRVARSVANNREAQGLASEVAASRQVSIPQLFNTEALDFLPNILKAPIDGLIEFISKAPQAVQAIKDLDEKLEMATNGAFNFGKGLRLGIGALALYKGAELFLRPLLYSIENIPYAVQGFVSKSLEYFMELQTVKINLNISGEQDANEALDRLMQKSLELGISARDAYREFAQFKIVTVTTPLEGQANTIFEGFQTALATRQTSREQQTESFRAIRQIGSRGKISLEEFTQQLTETGGLSDALVVAARSMGLTTAEFYRQAEAGKLLVKDVLPRMAAEYQRVSASSLKTGQSSFQAEINRTLTEFQQIQLVVGQALAGPLKGGLQAVNVLLKFVERNIGAISQVLGAGIIAAIGFLLKTIWELSAAFRVSSGLMSLWQGALLATGATAGATATLNQKLAASFALVQGGAMAAMKAMVVPGLVIAGISELWRYINLGSDSLKLFASNAKDAVASVNKLGTKKPVDLGEPGRNYNITGTEGDFVASQEGFKQGNVRSKQPQTLAGRINAIAEKVPLASLVNSTLQRREIAPLSKDVQLFKTALSDSLTFGLKLDNFLGNAKGMNSFRGQLESIRRESSLLEGQRDIAVKTERPQVEIDALDKQIVASKTKEQQLITATFGTSSDELQQMIDGVTGGIETYKKQFAEGNINSSEFAMNMTTAITALAQLKALQQRYNDVIQDTNYKYRALEFQLEKINVAEKNRLFSLDQTSVAQELKTIQAFLQNQLNPFEFDIKVKQESFDMIQQKLSILQASVVNTAKVFNDSLSNLSPIERGTTNKRLNQLFFADLKPGENFTDALSNGKISPESIAEKAKLETIEPYIGQLLNLAEKYAQARASVLATEKEATNLQKEILIQQLQRQQAARAFIIDTKANQAEVQLTDRTVSSRDKTLSVEKTRIDLAANIKRLDEAYAKLEDKRINDPQDVLKEIDGLLLTIAQGRLALRDSDLELQDYYMSFNRQIEDFARTIEDAQINSYRSVRGLRESYSDLVTSLDQQLASIQTELKAAQDELKVNTLKNKFSLKVGSGYGKQILDMILSAQEQIDSSDNERNSLNNSVGEINNKYRDTLRQIRAISEQQLDLERERLYQLRDLYRQQFDLVKQWQEAIGNMADLIKMLKASKLDLVKMAGQNAIVSSPSQSKPQQFKPSSQQSQLLGLGMNQNLPPSIREQLMKQFNESAINPARQRQPGDIVLPTPQVQRFGVVAEPNPDYDPKTSTYSNRHENQSPLQESDLSQLRRGQPLPASFQARPSTREYSPPSFPVSPMLFDLPDVEGKAALDLVTSAQQFGDIISGISDQSQSMSFSDRAAQIPPVVNLTPIPKLDYQLPMQKAEQLRGLEQEKLNVDLQNNQLKSNQALIEALQGASALATELRDKVISINQEMAQTSLGIEEMVRGSKGYLSTLDEIYLLGQRTSLDYASKVIELETQKRELQRSLLGNFEETRNALNAASPEFRLKLGVEKIEDLQDAQAVIKSLKEVVSDNPDLQNAFGELIGSLEQYAQGLSTTIPQLDELIRKTKEAGQIAPGVAMQRKLDETTFGVRQKDLGLQADRKQAEFDNGSTYGLFNEAPLIRYKASFEEARRELDLFIESNQALIDQSPVLQGAVQSMVSNFEALQSQNYQDALKASMPWVDSLADAFLSVTDRSQSATEALLNFAREAVKIALKQAVMKLLFMIIGGVTGGGKGGSSAGGGFMPGGGYTVAASKGGFIKTFAGGGLSTSNNAPQFPLTPFGVERAMVKEKLASGHTPRLAIVNDKEFIVPAKEGMMFSEWKQAQRMQSNVATYDKVKTYSSGGFVGVAPRTSSVSYGNTSSSQTVYNTTVNVSDRNDLGYSLNQLKRKERVQADRNDRFK